MKRRLRGNRITYIQDKQGAAGNLTSRRISHHLNVKQNAFLFDIIPRRRERDFTSQSIRAVTGLNPLLDAIYAPLSAAHHRCTYSFTSVGVSARVTRNAIKSRSRRRRRRRDVCGSVEEKEEGLEKREKERERAHARERTSERGRKAGRVERSKGRE